MLKELKEKVCQANIELKRQGVVIYTWGNVSEIDSDRKYMAIKPSGIAYEKLTPKDIVILDLDGNIIEGELNPSSDSPTHLYLYNHLSEINAIVHTHSINATAFAQAGCNIIPGGTTHADYFFGDIQCTRELTVPEVQNNYELNTGKVIVETINNNRKNPLESPGILVKSHGPFAWGKDCFEAVHNAVVIETIAEMALKTKLIKNSFAQIPEYILKKHYSRKHGETAYYGQKKLTTST